MKQFCLFTDSFNFGNTTSKLNELYLTADRAECKTRNKRCIYCTISCSLYECLDLLRTHFPPSAPQSLQPNSTQSIRVLLLIVVASSFSFPNNTITLYI